MKNPGLEQALSDVTEALDKVNKAFEKHLQGLQQSGGDSGMIRQTGEAVRSLRDSAAMYLAWAHHYAGVPQPDEPISSPDEV